MESFFHLYSLVLRSAKILAQREGQTRTELAALNQEWLFLISDPAISEVFGRTWLQNDQEGLDPAELLQADLLMVANIRRLENVYYQYAEGLVDESALDSYGFQTSSPLFGTVIFSNWWFSQNNRNLFHPGFVDLFESKVGIRESET